MPRVLGGSYGYGRVLMSEVPPYKAQWSQVDPDAARKSITSSPGVSSAALEASRPFWNFPEEVQLVGEGRPSCALRNSEGGECLRSWARLCSRSSSE